MKYRGTSQDLPHSQELDGYQRSERGMGTRAGIVVPVGASGGAARVVPTSGVVQGHVHELGKGDPTLRGYPGSYLTFGRVFQRASPSLNVEGGAHSGTPPFNGQVFAAAIFQTDYLRVGLPRFL